MTPELIEATLATERLTFKHTGAKERHIQDAHGVTATAYYQQLRHVVLLESAYAADPMLVGRIRDRMRTVRRASV